jgi:hypothetical protein
VGRAWDSAAFDAAYVKHLCQEGFPFGNPDYYARYRSRYKLLLERFAQLAPPEPVDVLDMGGGQLSLLCNRLWNDRATVADLPGERQLDYLRTKGLSAFTWNLCTGEQPCVAKFDCIFFGGHRAPSGSRLCRLGSITQGIETGWHPGLLNAELLSAEEYRPSRSRTADP